jgi:FtsZ-interacting cell division protein YlmF
MTEESSPDSQAPVFVVTDFSDTYKVVNAYREHDAVIADVRQVREPALQRVLDMLEGAAIARGYSPFLLDNGVYFLTNGRIPHGNDWS